MNNDVFRGATNCNIIPRGNNVLVRLDFTASVLDLSTGKPSERSEGDPVIFSIAGYGPLVKDLSIGEKVIMKLEPYKAVEVKGNEQSVAKLTAFFSSANMKLSELQEYIKSTPKVNVVEYGIFPEFIIKGIIDEN
jgi:hypothetical protein